VAADGSYAQVGVAIGGDWSEWYLECPRPAVPDISDHRIWETS